MKDVQRAEHLRSDCVRGGLAEQPGINHIAVAAPANGAIAPPGHYMFFVLSAYAANQSAPCVQASYVRVGP